MNYPYSSWPSVLHFLDPPGVYNRIQSSQPHQKAIETLSWCFVVCKLFSEAANSDDKGGASIAGTSSRPTCQALL